MKIFLMSLFALVGFSLFFLACTNPSAQKVNDPVASEPVGSDPAEEHPTFNKEMAIGIGEDSVAAYALIASGEEPKRDGDSVARNPSELKAKTF
jgi:hypothetical protein